MAEAARAKPMWLVMTALMLADLTSSLETSMIFSAFPTIVRETGDMVAAGWLITAFAIVAAISAAVGGRLGDIFGRRRILIIVLLGCTGGSLLSWLGQSLELIIAGRALQGVSGAVLPLCFGLLRRECNAIDLPFLVGILTGVYAGAGALGYLSGAYFAQYLHWQWMFALTAILPVLAIAAIMLAIPRSEPVEGNTRIDWLGALLLGVAISAFLLTISRSSSWGWLSSNALAGWLVAAGAAAGWLWWELRHPDPLINIRLLGDRQIAIANSITVLLAVGALQLPLVLMLLLQQPAVTGIGLGIGAVLAAILKLPGNGCSGLAAVFSGHSTRRRGPRFSAIVGGLCLVAAWAAVILWPNSLAVVTFTMSLGSFGAGALLATVPNVVLAATPAERSSEATGMSTVMRSMGSAVGAQLCTLLLASSQVSFPGGRASFPDTTAYMLAFTFILVTSFACLLLSFALTSSKPVPDA